MKRMLSVASGLAALAYVAAQAQTTTTSSNSTDALDEIVVTAQKRSENLQNVPIAITAITSGALSKQHISTTEDLQFLVPSLNYSYVPGAGQPFLRGVGSNLTFIGADASVATYVDGVFQADNNGIVQALLGVERIEVLEGPQGTLYGRNAVGGAINIYTLTPTQQFDSAFSATVGDYSRQELSGHISGGITENLAVGIYAEETTRRSFYNYVNNFSLDTPARAVLNQQAISDHTHENREETRSVRLKAVWTPTDAIKLTGSVDYMLMDSAEAGTFRNLSPYAAGFEFYTPNLSRTIAPYYIQSDNAQYENNEQYGFSLREEVNFGWAQLLGISAFRLSQTSESEDIDAGFSPFVQDNAPDDGAKTQSVTQELQLLSPKDSWITWIGGVYLLSQLSQYDPNTLQSSYLYLPSDIYGSNNYGKVQTQSFAAFAQGTIPLDVIAQGLRATLGGRYTADHKYWYGAYTDAQDELGNLIPGSTETYGSNTHEWRKFSPKVSLDYKIADTLIYATWSQGFKAGVYNLAAPTAVGPVNPENLTSYEIGHKSDLFDGRVRVNGAAFYYDFKDLQVTQLNASIDPILQNAAAAKLYGFEESVQARITHDLTLSAAVTALHTKYSSFPDNAGYAFNMGPLPGISPSISIDSTGQQLSRSPKWVETLGASYDVPFENGAGLNFSLDAYFNSGFFWDSADQLRQNAYHLVNASGQYTFQGGRWSLRAWATNLTNTFHENTELPLNFGPVGQDAPPRMYGLTLDFRFNK